MVSVILCLLSTLFTFAKGGWLITFFMGAVFVFLLFRDHDVKKLAFMAGMTVVILLPLFFLWQPVSEQTMLRIKSSVRSRTYTWKYAWRGIAQNPLFGVGQAQGPIALVDMSALLEKYYHDHSTPAAIDNYYLEYLLEEGAAGFLPFLLFLVLLFYRGARGLFRPAHSGMLIPVFAGLAALCLDAVTFDALTWWSLFICFWVFAGLLNGLAAEGRAEGETETVKGIAAAGTEL
ncbi:MAG: O-antigen ligase family protein [Actinobacteria bacterium]|nr:O-antigen ligase family protein [Actinomycetota bacterium]